MSVKVLPSARLRSARANLEHMVSHARDEVAAFGPDLPFEADVWNVCGSQAVRASAQQSYLLYFTTHEGGKTKGSAERTPFTEPFASFIKAVIRLSEERGHVVANQHRVTIRSARYLYDATAHVGHDPCQLVPLHFHEAANLCRAREMESSRYRVGRALLSISSWVNSYNISAVRIDFRNPFPRADHSGTRIGAEADGRRAEKMPSGVALDSLAWIANQVEQPRDILCMRAIELLVCGGWRINEALTLPADCEIIEGVFKNGEPVVGPDGHLLQRYGIRYFGEKGAGARTKWIPTPMVDVAKRAVSDILRITESARKVAIWMKQHPGQAWLAGKWAEAPDDATMTAYDVAEALGRPTKASGLQAIRRFGIRHGFSGRAWVVRKSDLVKALQAAQSEPERSDIPLSTSEHLFLMHLDWFRSETTSVEAVVVHVQDRQIYQFLAGPRGQPSIFERFGMAESDGSKIRVTSHSFRHWLNTLAQEGGMSQMEIARWSGRKDVGQNAEYDHISGVQLAERARAMLAKGQVHGPVAEAIERLPAIRRADFAKMQFATAHTTDLGLCVNDWSLAPCMEHGACAGCQQHLVKKGDAAQRDRAEVMLHEHEMLLRHAQAEAEDETYGASNYVAHHSRTVDALHRILDVHGNPGIPNGDLVEIGQVRV